MSVLVMLIAAGGTVASGFLIAFVWAVRSGQFDDTFTPAVRVLLDGRDAGSELRTEPRPFESLRVALNDVEGRTANREPRTANREPR